MKYAKSKNLTAFDVVTIASMVEREAGVPKQRKLVASVIYNRLREGMPLGIDSTIRFATGNYEKPLTRSELGIKSPYNTRTHVGLPPGPIDSPGLAALRASAQPAKTRYLFYVDNPDSCDELSFAVTEEEFVADVEEYEAAREANGATSRAPAARSSRQTIIAGTGIGSTPEPRQQRSSCPRAPRCRLVVPATPPATDGVILTLYDAENGSQRAGRDPEGLARADRDRTGRRCLL